MSNKTSRLRRARKPRATIRRIGALRLQVHRTPQHIYARVIKFDGEKSLVLASASSLDKDLRASLSGSKTDVAKAIGKTIAERAVKNGIKQVAFDRSGFRFHGRIKALADAAREAGLEF